MRGVRVGRTLGPNRGLRQDVAAGRERRNLVTLKMTEWSRNVYENKGPAFSGRHGSWNVIENKGSYPLLAGMWLKIKEL
jgi:hypothetical protein